MGKLKKYDVLVDKILYQNKMTSYSVFNGVVMRWSARKKEYLSTKEKRVFVGYFSCLFQGDRFSIEAEETFNRNYGTQYLVVNSSRAEPCTAIEIRNFLSKNIKGMTPKRIEKVMNKYGLDAIHAIIQDAHAYDFLKIAKDNIDEIRSQLLQNASFERLLAYIQLHHIDCRYAGEIYKKYKDEAVTAINHNPYTLYIDRITEFKIADKLYLDLGKDPSSPKRCLYVTLATLQMDSCNSGNVYTQKSKVREKMMCFLTETSKCKLEDRIPFTQNDIENAIAELENSGYIISNESDNETKLYLKSNFFYEKKIVSALYELKTEPKRIAYSDNEIEQFLSDYQARTRLKLAEKQISAVKMALQNPVSIISGGPGTGKTQTINTIISAIQTLTPEAVIRTCAPTGKASIRITELTGIPSSTIHRALGIGRYSEELSKNELLCDFMFVDEFSMVDIELCAKLFDRINKMGRIIMIGDYNQLPSVGPGLVLRDLIESGTIPVTILTEIFRQKNGSRIINNAHAIINQNPNEKINLKIAKRPNEDFYFIPETDSEKIMEKVQASIKKLRQNYGYGAESVQVLSPVRFGMLGVDQINCTLQELMNQSPVQFEYEDRVFRQGDKVIHTKNNYKLEVFNGEVGFIKDISYKKDNVLTVAYPDRDVCYPFSALNELDLAYALTVHKLQGSEFPVIILPVHESQGISLSKNLIYTALTRAKKMVIIIGSYSAVSEGLRRETAIDRKSHLISRVRSVFSQVPCSC